MTPATQREAVAHLPGPYALLERRACGMLGSDRTAARYRFIQPGDGATRPTVCGQPLTVVSDDGKEPMSSVILRWT